MSCQPSPLTPSQTMPDHHPLTVSTGAQEDLQPSVSDLQSCVTHDVDLQNAPAYVDLQSGPTYIVDLQSSPTYVVDLWSDSM
eukprot:superscaffoldBa00002093_g13143